MELSTKDLGVLSDDLTSACDAAGYFVTAVGPVRIGLTPASLNGADTGLAVVPVQSRSVTLERALDGDGIVEKGLRPGETVVTDGHRRVVPDPHVQVKPAAVGGTPE